MSEDLSTALAEQYPAIRKFANYLTGQQAVADDLAQQTITKLLEKNGSIKNQNLRALTARTARNTWIDWCRKKNAQPLHNLEELNCSYEVNGNNDLSERVRSALKKLSPLQRALFWERAVNERKYGEIAEDYGIPIGSVCSYLSRARKRLKKELGKE